MDRIMKYREVIQQALTDYADLLKSPPEPEYDVVLVFDEERDQYLLRRLGWTSPGRIRYTDLHLSIRGGKIWIEEDLAEEGVATYLLEAGVPRETLCWAFSRQRCASIQNFRSHSVCNQLSTMASCSEKHPFGASSPFSHRAAAPLHYRPPSAAPTALRPSLRPIRLPAGAAPPPPRDRAPL